MILVHSVILLIGAHDTYARCPFFWIRDDFGHARNHYGRLGRFAQRFIPATLVREIPM